MSEDLNNFFKLISEDKKKKKEEFDSMVGDLGLDALFNEFAGLKKKEKEKKSKKKEPSIGNINLDAVFEEVSNLKKETKKKKIKEEKTVKAFEKWLYSDSEKEEEEVINEVIEKSLDEVLEVIEENEEKLEKTEEIKEKTFVDGSLKVLTEIGNNQSENIKEPDKKFATLEDLDRHYKVFLSRIQQQLSSLGGGGEVRLEFLDDVDKNTAKVDGKFLKYQSSTGKWIGADASGGGGGGGISGITVREEGSVVDTSNNVRDINFVSNNLTAAASGIGATITLSDTPTFTSIVIGSGVTINSDGINVTGVVTATSFSGSGIGLTGLTGASAATYGDASNVAQIVVDSNGRITGISEVTISGGGGGGSPGGSDGQIQYNNGGAFGGATQLFYDDSNNRVGINSATPTEALDVIGSVKATDFNTTSDKNLKNNIKTIENPLSKVLSIRGVNFEWKDSNKASAGVIAQEVEKVLPELVTGQNTKTVNYNGLIGLLIETVKEQQKQIDILSEKISKLE
jgi:hypothetical protein